MNNTLTYTGPIVAKPRMTQSDKWKIRPATSKYWAFKDLLTLQAKKQHFELGNRISVQVYIPMPKSWSQKKRIMTVTQPHRQKPDIDNILKSIQDILLKDDSCIREVHITKRWITSVTGRIEIINL